MGVAIPIKNKKEDNASCLLFHVCFIKRAYQVCVHFDYIYLWWLHTNPAGWLYISTVQMEKRSVLTLRFLYDY